MVGFKQDTNVTMRRQRGGTENKLQNDIIAWMAIQTNLTEYLYVLLLTVLAGPLVRQCLKRQLASEFKL